MKVTGFAPSPLDKAALLTSWILNQLKASFWQMTNSNLFYIFETFAQLFKSNSAMKQIEN